MNGKELLAGMSFISDALIHEASVPPRKKAAPMIRWISLAACLALVLTGGVLGLAGMTEKENISMQDSVNWNWYNGTGIQENAPAIESTVFQDFEAVAPPVIKETYGALHITWEAAPADLNAPFRFHGSLLTPESWSETPLEEMSVRLFLTGDGVRIARFAVDDLVYTVSASLDETDFLAALTDYLQTLN